MSTDVLAECFESLGVWAEPAPGTMFLNTGGPIPVNMHNEAGESPVTETLDMLVDRYYKRYDEASSFNPMNRQQIRIETVSEMFAEITQRHPENRGLIDICWSLFNHQVETAFAELSPPKQPPKPSRFERMLDAIHNARTKQWFHPETKRTRRKLKRPAVVAAVLGCNVLGLVHLNIAEQHDHTNFTPLEAAPVTPTTVQSETEVPPMRVQVPTAGESILHLINPQQPQETRPVETAPTMTSSTVTDGLAPFVAAIEVARTSIANQPDQTVTMNWLNGEFPRLSKQAKTRIMLENQARLDADGVGMTKLEAMQIAEVEAWRANLAR